MKTPAESLRNIINLLEGNETSNDSLNDSPYFQIEIIMAKNIDRQAFQSEIFQTQANMKSRQESALKKARNIIQDLNNEGYEIKKRKS